MLQQWLADSKHTMNATLDS